MRNSNKDGKLKFLKFWSVMNLLTGILLLLVGLVVGVIGTIIELGQASTVLQLLKPLRIGEEHTEMINAYFAADGKLAQDTLNMYLEQFPELPQVIRDFLVNDFAFHHVLMIVGYSVAGYALIVHTVLNSLLLKNIRLSRLGRANFSRALAVFVSLLSIVPFVIIGVFMLLGSLGKRPLGSDGRQRQMQSRRPYGPRQRPRYS